MLSQKDITAIAAILKLTPEALKTAWEAKEEVTLKVKEGDKEVDLDITQLTAFTPSELATRDANTKDAGKSGYITAGKEMAIKELKEKLGLELAGKDPDKFIEAAKSKILEEAKVAPNARIQELENQLKTLRDNGQATEGKLAQLEREKEDARLEARLLTSLPKNRNPAFSDEDYLLLVKNKVKADKDSTGKEVFKDAAGNILTDKQAVPKDLKTVITELFSATPSWTTEQRDDRNGRGGGSSGLPGGGGSGNTPTTYSEAQKEWEAQGKHVNSADFSTYITKLSTDNKDFKMDIGMGEPPPTS